MLIELCEREIIDDDDFSQIINESDSKTGISL
jgi:hypothetical protein